MNPVAEEQKQTALLDLSGAEFNVMWVDEGQALFVANNPLHWKAHKLQVAIQRMDKISEKNPAQFNATAYFAALDKLGELMEQINVKQKAMSDEQSNGSGALAENGNEGAASALGARNAPSVDSGISADNPFAR